MLLGILYNIFRVFAKGYFGYPYARFIVVPPAVIRMRGSAFPVPQPEISCKTLDKPGEYRL